jgi:hypothetical protein
MVDSLTSNIGHLLWSGIVDDDKADAVAAHLMGPRLFSGWGVRTMAEGDGGYNPIGYHNGTVWPHDNSFIAAGLARYGFREEAARIALAMLEAAEFFHHRLPEVFAGYPRSETRFPVEYPTACSPQAWAAGAPLLCMTTVLGLQPSEGGLVTDPVLPEGVDHLELRSALSPARSAYGDGATRAAAPGERRTYVPTAGLDAMVESARDFFERWIPENLDGERLRGTDATYRFDVLGAGSWRVVVRDGELSVSESDAEAACVLRLSEDVLLKIVRGEQNSITAFLTGSLKVQGDLALAPKLDKLFSSFKAVV